MKLVQWWSVAFQNLNSEIQERMMGSRYLRLTLLLESIPSITLHCSQQVPLSAMKTQPTAHKRFFRFPKFKSEQSAECQKRLGKGKDEKSMRSFKTKLPLKFRKMLLVKAGDDYKLWSFWRDFVRSRNATIKSVRVNQLKQIHVRISLTSTV